MKEKSNNVQVIIYVILGAFTFSTMEVALKLSGASFDPLQLTALRFLIGGLCLLPMAVSGLKKRDVHLTGKDYGYLSFLGVFCICVSMLFFQFGVMYSNASTSAVVFSCNPMFTMLFAHFLTEEKLNKRKLLALAISLVGLVIIAKPWDMAPGNTLKGISMSLMAAVTFGLYTALGKKSIGRIGGLPQTSISFIIGGIVLLILTGFMGRPTFGGISMANILPLIYVGVVVTGMGYLFYFKAIELGSAAKGSVVFFLKPMMAPVIALVVVKEPILWNTVAGVVVMAIGSYINMSGNRK